MLLPDALAWGRGRRGALLKQAKQVSIPVRFQSAHPPTPQRPPAKNNRMRQKNYSL